MNLNAENPLFDYIFVGMKSTELKLFFYRLFENVIDLIRGHICTRCWGVVHLNHKKIHDFHKKYLIPGVQVSNEDLFYQTAKKYGMISGEKVAIMRPSHEIYKASQKFIKKETNEYQAS